ncbi:MAG: DNA polymerase III subunit chi [Thiotrichales bacterium SG8_50]|nr:MAG: DNA polymerase III subunit chi [Thiotrichales bacterium SG8_50]
MTRIDFYLVKSESVHSTELLTCRLAEKAYTLGHRVYIHSADDAQLERLDDLLWTFAAGSFVPHVRLQGEQGDDAPVVLSTQAAPAEHTDVLINLADEVPLFFSRFERVAEIVGADAALRSSARERYRYYRDRGYPLETHELDA